MPGTATILPGLRSSLAPALAVLAVGVLALLAIFLPEARAAVATWDASTAYGHCYLILPMALYLCWERRGAVTGLVPRPEPVLTLLALPVAAGWLMAERLGIMEGRQLMAIAAVEVLLLSVLGRTLFTALLGPLLYLVFLVPFGAFLTPALQHFTARFTVMGLNLLQIPNISNELTIEIPAGVFYVAEACAGLRFLIAAIAFGVFYALLNYRSPGRRAAFIAASIVIPVVANGFRALGIVALGHVLGSAEAAAADHVIYGWVFFSTVILLLVAAGLPLREPPLVRAVNPFARRPPPPGVSIWGALFACLLAACGPAGAMLLDHRATPAEMRAFPALVIPPGCTAGGPAPAMPAAQAAIVLVCGGSRFDVALAAFPTRSTSAAINQQRRIATSESVAEEVEFGALPVSAGHGSWTLVLAENPYRATAFAAWIEGAPAQGGLAIRLRQARASLLGSRNAPILMTIGTMLGGRMGPDQRRRVTEIMRRIIEAQPALDTQIEQLSGLAGGG